MTAIRRELTAGFTLIEALIATALLALLLVGALSALDTGGRSWRNMNKKIEHGHEIASVVDLLRALFEAAYPSAVANGPSDWQIAFAGGADGVEFATLPPPALSGAGPLRIRLQSTQGGGISLSYAPDRHQIQIAASELTSVHIAPELAAIRFAYWGTPDSGTAPVWQGSWVGRRELPRLVRAEVVMKGYPPSMHFFAPRLTADATCQFDVVSKRCTGR
jgi:type II secretory pathway pseudopilin PulG